MVAGHGQKRYFQILLDPNRAALIENLADQKGVRATALIREMVYQQLAQSLPNKYPQAAHIDGLIWKQSVKNRIAGRMQAKQKAS